MVRRLQGDHARYLEVTGCAKHFAVHSGLGFSIRSGAVVRHGNGSFYPDSLVRTVAPAGTLKLGAVLTPTMSVKTELERGMAEPSNPEWITATAPPPAYTIVMLSFEDGSVRRGVWNGKMWWGYDDRVKRACPLHPVRWRIWTETSSVISSARILHQR